MRSLYSYNYLDRFGHGKSTVGNASGSQYRWSQSQTGGCLAAGSLPCQSKPVFSRPIYAGWADHFRSLEERDRRLEIHQAITRLAEEEKIFPPVVVAISSTLNRPGDYLPAKALSNPTGVDLFEESRPLGKTATGN